MKHFVKVVQKYATTNKLERSILHLLEAQDFMLLEKKFLPTFIEEIEIEIAKINSENPRCKPKSINKWTNDLHTTCMSVDNVAVVHVYRVMKNS
jgi:hypothetical protein